MKAHQRKNGTWEVKGVDPVTGRRRSFYGKTEQEALAKATPNDRDTLIGFYEQAYLPTIQHLSINYVQHTAFLFEKYLAPAFGDTALENLERVSLQRHFNNLKLSVSSKRIVRSLFVSILKLAKKDGLVKENVGQEVRLAEPRPVKHKAISAEDLRRLVEHGGELREFILLAGCAGLRRGEALGAGSAQVTKDVLSVEQQVQYDRKGKSRLQDELKTMAAYREIPLPFDLPKAAFFCTVAPLNVRYRLHLLCDELGIPRISAHALRHTFITILEDELECPRHVVQALVGHKRPGITDRYSKVTMETKRRWMKLYWEHVSTARTTTLVVNEGK
jgi:integrase